MTGLALSAQAADESRYRRLSVDDYRDHLKGGWIGQMAGVWWGQPTEFKVKGRIMLESEMPPWTPDMVNQQDNDDCYVEQTFSSTAMTIAKKLISQSNESCPAIPPTFFSFLF